MEMSRDARKKILRLKHRSDPDYRLALALEEWRGVQESASTFMNDQARASEALSAWSAKEPNRAIRDVGFNVSELMNMWSTVQEEFVKKLGEAYEQLDGILEARQKLSVSQGAVSKAAKKISSVDNDLRWARRFRKGGTVRILEQKRSEFELEHETATRSLQTAKAETELIKMIRFKAFLHRISDAYLRYGTTCCHVFEGQRDITSQIPDASHSNLTLIHYYGANYCRQRVELTQQRLLALHPSQVQNHARRAPSGLPGERRRRLAPSAPPSVILHEPPPPYSPEDPMLQRSITQQPLTNTVSQISM